MAIQKPSIPKGTRDFSPEEVYRRQFIFDKIRHQFQLFGFAPIETPSFENLSTLTGKYGEEGDRLIFKILNSGNYFSTFRINLYGYIESIHMAFFYYLSKVENLNDLYSDYYEGNYDDSLAEIICVFKNNPLTRARKLHYEDKYINIDNIHFKNIILGQIIEFIKCNSEILFSNDFKNEIQLIDEKSEIANPHIKKIINDLDNKAVLMYVNTLNSQNFSEQISEKALRYDLTVPFARYVVQHQNEITFPFKRYQMQPVWRADRPQKGRFREFYQCDADVVGSDSLLQEVELISLYDSVFSDLKIPVEIHLNNRKILSGLAEVADISNQLIDFTVALDKLDKIGEEKVKEEMLNKGIPQMAIDKLSPLFSLSGDFKTQLNALEEILKTSETGMKGIEEVRFVIHQIENLGLKSSELILNLTLARGLDYYTGAILEVKAKNVELGSIGGGGRYDDLTGIFGMKDLSGVGISFGLDRIYLVLEELDLFPKSIENPLDVLFINFGEKEAEKSMQLAKALRNENIRSEVYPDSAKMKKQMQYADKKSVKFLILIGEEELKSAQATIKNMQSGEQFTTSEKQFVLDMKGLV